jgi:DeoR/GlpR family transcriptional regulator of sugar metabolism
MLIAERHHRILELVRHRGYASFLELADALGISESTVRRDLRLLVSDGRLESTRGGAGLPRGATGARRLSPSGRVPRPIHRFPLAAARLEEGALDALALPDLDDPVPQQRKAIAAYAASLVEPGTAILMGPGRTTRAIAQHLVGMSHLTVVTNSLPVLAALADAPQIDVVMVGGTLHKSINALVGPITEQTLRGLRGAQAFLSGEGVSVDRGLSTPNVFAAATDRAFVAAARQVVVLADHTKIGFDTMCQTVPRDRIDVLVTDPEADAGVLRRLGAAGVRIALASSAAV